MRRRALEANGVEMFGLFIAFFVIFGVKGGGWSLGGTACIGFYLFLCRRFVWKFGDGDLMFVE